MSQDNQELVLPGERLATEEEFASSANTYIENGQIYSAIAGKVSIADGKISVHNQKKEIKKLRRNMLVLGTVTDDMRAVLFVKLDNVVAGGKEYMALKDGKILLPKERHGDRGGRGGFRGGDRRPQMHQMPQQTPKPCGVGDVILARVLGEEDDTYALKLDEPETGVVYAICEICGGELEESHDRNGFVCKSCKHVEYRKVSSLYKKPDEIERILTHIEVGR
jgi:exosome complex component CSL4